MWKQRLLGGLAGILAVICLGGCGQNNGDVTILRIANAEEYIDEGGWDTDETIQLENGTSIRGIRPMTKDFEEWYEETYGEKVRVEYSTYGTNEDLYNQMLLGNVFDLVCPSEYMIMTLMREGKLQAFSKDFQDLSNERNYYRGGVSPYIQSRMEQLEIDGEKLSDYGACFMWGIMGLVYNPDGVNPEDMKHWKVLLNPDYSKRITMKDSVRDSYFVALGILNEEQISESSFLQSSNYSEQLSTVLNDTSQKTVDQVEELLSKMRQNAYSLEVESGKADMVTGKVLINMQWSGDAVYSLDQAEEDGLELAYSVPEECSNLWFDGWCMMKDGVGEDARKQQAAEAFINYLSRPDNVIRNMYYIGYTSAIAGGDSDMIYQYAKYCYEAEEGEETAEYSLDYFFAGNSAEKGQYQILAEPSQLQRQLYAQYPPEDVLRKSAVMHAFDQGTNQRISRMWTNIRCFDFANLQSTLKIYLKH